MKVSFLLPSHALIVLAVAGCSELLNTHSSGSAPGGPGAIPGPPTGDALNAAGEVIFNEQNIQLLSTSETQTGVSLIPSQPSRIPDEYLINLSGVTLLTSPRPVLAIDAFDTEQRLSCGLEIGGGQFRLVGAGQTQVIGTYSGNADVHRILLRLSRVQDRCFINITQTAQGSEANAPLTQPPIDASGDFADPDFGTLARVQVAWEQPVRQQQTSYFLGPVVISTPN